MVVPLRYGRGSELLLYEIGVHRDRRRAGVGRALIQTMEHWMRQHDVVDIWVVADNPGAVAFYETTGFVIPEDVPTYLVREVPNR